ncbi:GGDEF domain-containing protein [Salinimonas marina]|uniref:diguanylate cyclase n=1 Tax=Salinimonas marina TaxID=2785918 RepID=A0A7S9DXB9_9ALTE|nr:GGDEF domain-containing protein [Salinimonas marina]QPG04990.1 GGDEF domain-containing protein [Salinimonas marina]
MSCTQFQAFVGRLLSTLDFQKLGKLYHHELACYLPLRALTLMAGGVPMSFGQYAPQNPAGEQLNLPILAHADRAEHSVQYYFTRSLTRGERKLVEQLHCVFSKQLLQALAFNNLKALATKDTLTGLSNRNGFNEACSRLLSRAIRYEEAFALLIIDLDNFKTVNDTRGHKEGDKVLARAAEDIHQSLRGEDEAFRFGGDEFCCLLHCVTDACIDAVARRLQHTIAGNDYLRQRGFPVALVAPFTGRGMI